MRRAQVVTAACAALMWTAAAGVPLVAAQTAGSGSAQGSSQAGSSAGPTTGTSGIGDPDAQAGAATTTGTRSSSTNDAQQFVEKASVANMAEIQLGQLALTKAQDPQVKQFAQMMVDDHTQALEQLRTAASSQGLQVASALDSKHQKLHDKLSKLQGAEFDRAYMDAMVDAHKSAEKLLKSRAGASESASASNMSTSPGASAAGASGTSPDNASGANATGTSGAGNESGTSATGTSGTSGSTGSAAAGTASSSTGASSATGAAPASADQWAALTLPKVRAHLEQARTLEDQVKQAGRSDDKSNNAPAAPGSAPEGSTGSTPPTPPQQ